MNQATCSSCKHFHPHYTFNQRKIFRVYCGHCTCLMAKTRRPDAKICERYAQTDPNEAPFVSKEYLSKALLEYMMKLELLPEIYDPD